MRIPKRIFFSVLVVLLWFGFVVDGAHALFTEQATLAGTTINTGTAHLLVSNSQNPTSSLFDTTRPGFVISNLVPGESVDHFFLLKNTSDPNIDFDIAVQATIHQDVQTSALLNSALSVEIYPVDDTGTIGESGFTSLLISFTATSRTTGFIIPQGVTKRFVLRVTLDQNFTDQDASTAFDLTFTGTQHTG